MAAQTSACAVESHNRAQRATEAARVQRFLFQRLFRRDWLLSLSGESPLLALLARQSVHESSLEKGFYFEYRDYRLALYRALLTHNPQYKAEPRTLVRLTQKLLDRFLFILFCEDMGARLDYPHNLLRDILTTESRGNYFNPVESDLWTGKVKQIFSTMRDGGKFGPHTLNRFNGGMFAVDSALDALVVPNQILCAKNQGASDASLIQHRDTLLYFAAHYNFGVEDGGERAVGLYTLGRIFEQSITDLEIMEAEAANEQSLMKRRSTQSTQKPAGSRIKTACAPATLQRLKTTKSGLPKSRCSTRPAAVALF